MQIGRNDRGRKQALVDFAFLVHEQVFDEPLRHVDARWETHASRVFVERDRANLIVAVPEIEYRHAGRVRRSGSAGHVWRKRRFYHRRQRGACRSRIGRHRCRVLGMNAGDETERNYDRVAIYAKRHGMVGGSEIEGTNPFR